MGEEQPKKRKPRTYSAKEYERDTWMSFLVGGLVGAGLGFFVFSQAWDVGKAIVYEEPCGCGQVRPCTFGAGILGVQKCGSYDHEWDECVPQVDRGTLEGMLLHDEIGVKDGGAEQ